MTRTSNRNRARGLTFLLAGCLVLALASVSYGQPLQKQDFESGWDGWTTDNPAIWEVGNPTVGPGAAYEGDSCAGTILDGDYTSWASARLISPTFVVPAAGDYPILRFYHWYSIADDWARVQIRVSGGAWQNLTTEHYAGEQTNWEYEWIDLSAYGGQSVEVAFYFGSDELLEAAGWYVDNVSVTTGVQGTVSDTWLIDYSPYHVVGALDVQSLVIDPGVIVLTHGSYSIDINGPLTAVGTPSNSIVFKRALENTGWAGLRFLSGSGGSELTHARITQSINCGLRILDVTPTISYCAIEGNTTSGRGGGIYIEMTSTTDTLVLQDCVISNNTAPTHAGGVNASIQSGYLYINNCVIRNNYVNPGWAAYTTTYAGGILASANGGHIVMNQCVIDSNTCYAMCNGWNCSVYAYGGGMYADGTGSTTVRNCTFADNTTIADDEALGGNEKMYSRGAGLMAREGAVTVSNCIFVCNYSACWGTSAGHRPQGSGVFVWDALTSIENCTFSANSHHGIWNVNGPTSVLNSILYFNNSGGSQTAGSITTTFCNIQGVDTVAEPWNIDMDPEFVDGPCNDVYLQSSSPCIDRGDPNPTYNDACFPPSQGTVWNDIGAYGGPGACGWQEVPTIHCWSTTDTSLCAYGEVCLELLISNADIVHAGDATWSADSLCFTADTAGFYDFSITASNANGSTTCDLTIYVRPPDIELTPDNILFYTTDTATTIPDSQMIFITSPCLDGASDWTLTVEGDYFGWLNVDKTSGTNPDSITLRIDDSTYTPGAYSAVLVFRDGPTQDILANAHVSLFVESGVTVGSELITAGQSVKLPINIAANQPVDSFVIPLVLETQQPQNVYLDSVLIDSAYVDSLILIDDSTFILKRVVQNPPMPPDTQNVMTVGEIFVTTTAEAFPELAMIDTTTVTNGIDYSYRFYYSSGIVDTPYFSPGIIAIDTTLPPASCCHDRGNVDGVIGGAGPIDNNDVVYLVDCLYRGGPEPPCLEEGDVNGVPGPSGPIDIADLTYLIAYVYQGGPPPPQCDGDGMAKAAHGIDINVSISAVIEEQTTTFVICNNSELSGVHLELEGNTGTPISLVDDDLNLVFGETLGILKVGILDLTGDGVLPVGQHALFKVDGKCEIRLALASDIQHRIIEISETAIKPEPNLPFDFTLSQNYPNPFNPTTTIEYGLPVSTEVMIAIFNVLGQEVAVLVDGEKEAGYHTVTWDSRDAYGSQVSSGVYFYRIQAGEFVETKKMLLLK